jgi:multicomponent Na+:H+ antiporter subunit E
VRHAADNPSRRRIRDWSFTPERLRPARGDRLVRRTVGQASHRQTESMGVWRPWGRGSYAGMVRRWLALFCIAYATWIILSWTRTAEQLLVGAVFAAMVAVACAPLGPVAAPWLLLTPRRLVATLRTAVWAVGQIVRANLSLSRRIWSPRRPLRPGMVIVPTEMDTDGELAAVGLITSLIVDNQLVDLDRRRHELLYHTVWVDTEDPQHNRSKMNGPVEDHLKPIVRP